MATTMHRLQISLPEWQSQFLAERARQQGVSIAEVLRRLVRREAESADDEAAADSLLDIAGIAEDHGPLLQGVPVSESPERYLTAPSSRRPDEE